MKKAPYIFGMLAVATAFTSCKDENQENAERRLDNYTHYIDSISEVAEDKAATNWEAIEADYNEAKMDVENAINTASDKEEIQEKMDKASMKYDEYKTKVVAFKQSNKDDYYKSLFGPSYVSDDMKFAWVNKDNILAVYDNFVTTVEKNKDSYSREDWDEIKMYYEALDSRKNTVEKEGLSSTDNRKIAGLKIKFAPMYTVNRMGAKSEENAAAKQ